MVVRVGPEQLAYSVLEPRPERPGTVLVTVAMAVTMRRVMPMTVGMVMPARVVVTATVGMIMGVALHLRPAAGRGRTGGCGWGGAVVFG